MIAAVKGCHAVLSALLFLILPAAHAADDMNGAARELARKTAALGKADPQKITWRNISSLGTADLAQARAAFEKALPDMGARDGPPVSLRMTLSENPTQYLLIAEAQSGDENQVWVAGWPRGGSRRPAALGESLHSRLLWEQDEPILDAAVWSDSVLVLSPAAVTWRGQTAALPAQRWPRDLRGRLRGAPDSFQVFLPGMACAGSTTPALHLDCRASEAPWVLEPGPHAILLANYTPLRNYFDGRLVTQSGAHKTVAPFFSAAAIEDQGRTSWLLSTLDGDTQILDADFNPQASISSWGSDIAPLDARCGGATQVVATRPGDGSDPDAAQAFSIVNGAPVPLTARATFAGPVTALWPSGSSSVVAVAHDLSTGKYGAYALTVSCGI